MADNRDYRIRTDLSVPSSIVKAHPEKLETLKELLTEMLDKAVVINEGQPNEERGYIEVERCGHRTGESCNKIARWEVDKGRVL